MRVQFAVLLLFAVSVAIGQDRPNPVPPGIPILQARSDALGSKPLQLTETLAVNDQLLIVASDVEGITEQPFRVAPDGTVTLPLLGKVRALGLTVAEVEKELTGQLAVYIRSPKVTVKRLPARADTIVVAGAFKTPGVYPLSERRALLDVLAATGGLQPNTTRTIKITRRLEESRKPLPSGVEDREAGVSTASINLLHLIESPGLGEDLIIEPDDVLFAEPAGTVFITGEVLKPGSFDLGEKDSLSLTELIAQAGGLGRDAGADKIKILRPILNGSRRAEVPVNTKRILEGRVPDFRVLPNDMVFVPRSKSKARAIKTAVMYVVPAAVASLVYLAVRR